MRPVLEGRSTVDGDSPAVGFRRRGGMAGLTQAEKIAELQPDFQGLLDAWGVDAAMQEALYDNGVKSIAMLSAIATDGASLLDLAKSEMGIDVAVRPADAIRFAALFLTWQSAVKRTVAMDEMDAEAVTHKTPKAVPGVEMQLYRSEFERKFYKLKDSECPGKPSFEDVRADRWGEFRAMALRHFGSRAEEDEAGTGNLQVGKTGQVRIKKSRVETSMPTNMEGVPLEDELGCEPPDIRPFPLPSQAGFRWYLPLHVN